MYKKGLPSVKSHKVIYVPKLLESLTPDSLTEKVLKKQLDIDPQFVIKQKPFDPKYFSTV